eukprot:TRINITY_DN14452_c0_g1_i3.p1 TRINITY_DN14452_c0_g1~~TRINITY_DN14452_c0_g1_i3.p1  ORF type:complete len:207 (+),score=43.82 TRINITY_DN14452_c0_g1_i3:144-764(+)
MCIRDRYKLRMGICENVMTLQQINLEELKKDYDDLYQEFENPLFKDLEKEKKNQDIKEWGLYKLFEKIKSHIVEESDSFGKSTVKEAVENINSTFLLTSTGKVYEEKVPYCYLCFNQDTKLFTFPCNHVVCKRCLDVFLQGRFEKAEKTASFALKCPVPYCFSLFPETLLNALNKTGKNSKIFQKYLISDKLMEKVPEYCMLCLES